MRPRSPVSDIRVQYRVIASQSWTLIPSTPLQIICISVLFFGNVVNKFHDIPSIFKYVVIFPEYSDLFRIVKTNMDDLQPTFL